MPTRSAGYRVLVLGEDTVELRLGRLRRQAAVATRVMPSSGPPSQRIRASRIVASVFVGVAIVAAGVFAFTVYGLLAALAVLYVAPPALFLVALLISFLMPDEPVVRDG
jgi:hypothetical protein